MPKRKAQDEADTEAPQGTRLPLPAGTTGQDDPEPSRQLQNGRTSIDWLRWAYRKNTRLMMDVAQGIADMPRGYNPAQVRDLLDAECKASGMDPRHLADTRTDAQINQDWADTIIKTPDEVFAAVDSFLDEAEKQMDAADDFCGSLVDAVGTPGFVEKQLGKSLAEVKAEIDRADAKKKWLERIQRIRKLRDRARSPNPRCSSPGKHVAIAHPLRYMIYTSRPGGSASACYKVGFHHAKMAMAIYCVKHGKLYQDHQWVDCEVSGCLLVCPPGHGKTTIQICNLALRLSQNPRLRIIMLHAQAGQAEKNMAYLCTFFQPTEAAGRRNLSLFPGNRIIQQNASSMRLYLKEKQRQHTVVACGVNAKESGADADILAPDDMCDQQIAEQETERERVFTRYNGTWRARKRRNGKTEEIITSTLWHHDDPHCRMIKQGKEGTLKFVFCIQECGGPDQNFKALWPDVYGPGVLRSIYGEMRNPRLYAAAYQSNPMPEEQRPIRRLAYYDPTTESHRQFRESSIKYVSLDPAATANEKSDHASFTYAGMGEVETVVEGGVMAVQRLRILDAERFKAKQTDAVTAVCSYAMMPGRSVHYVLFENVAGFAAVGELFDLRGITAIPMPPKNRSKGLRLKDVAIMLDDSLQDKGLAPAVVEFPGKARPDGTIGPDSDSPIKWLEEQILNYGVAAEDDGLDTVTQLCKRLGPDLGVGQGGVTRILQTAAREESRIERALREVEEQRIVNKSPYAEETQWLLNNKGPQ